MAYTRTIILSLSGCFLAAAATVAQSGWEEENATSAWQDPQVQTTSTGYESATADPDATYVIKKGDTLWDLSFEFLGDPFLWQQLWQANSYIVNPDLIYPGNRLVIPGRQTDRTPYEGNDQFTSETGDALATSDSLKNSATDTSTFPSDSMLISLMRLKEVLSGAYLGQVPFLWFDRDQKGNIYPGNAVVDPPPTGASYQLFSMITITPFSNAVYHENDTLSIFSSNRFVRFNNTPANLIQRIGRAVVRKVEPKKIDALLFEMSDAIRGKERAMSMQASQQQIIDTLIDPSESISGKVFCRVEETTSPYPFQMIILDIGSTQGVRIGDVFGIYHFNDNSPTRLTVIGTIGHVGTKSSTLNMVYMIDNHVEVGDKAVLLRRAQIRSPAP